jgi:ribose transport system substrate-binding protein
MTSKVLLAGASCAVLMLAGCGSNSGESSGQTGSSTSDSVISQAQRNVDTYYTNTSVGPPTTGPAAVKGKSVAVLVAGLSAPTGAEGAAAVKEAGDRLGWKVTVFDGKFTPSVYQDSIRQAIASKVDGIVLYGVDCLAVKTALQQAKDAKIPVVGSGSQDCSEAPGGGPSLLSASVQYPPVPGSKTPLDGYTVWGADGAAKADWLIAKTGGQAKVLIFDLADFAATGKMTEAFKARLKQCSGCEIVDTVKIGLKDLGPNLQSIAEQALLKNPDANAVNGAYADPMILGIGKAIQASGRSDKLEVVAGIGSAPELNLVRENNGEDAGFVQMTSWDLYGAMDQLNRLFAGAPLAVSGYAMTMYDKDHNMPTSGPYAPKADYKGAFEKIWTGGAH